MSNAKNPWRRPVQTGFWPREGDIPGWHNWNYAPREEIGEEEVFKDIPEENLSPAEPATFAWVYWHRGAQSDELRWSIRSILANYHGEASIVVVGDPPSWYAGPAIRMNRVADCSFRCYRDSLNKLFAICTSDLVPEEFVWMMDDTYFVRRVSLSTLRRHFHGTVNKLRRGSWARYKDATFHELARRGVAHAVDYSTHMPLVLSKSKFLETWEKYDLGKRTLAWELLYGADHWHQGEVIDNCVFARIQKSNQRPDAAIWNNSIFGWGKRLRNFLQRRFPLRSRFEQPILKPMRQEARMRQGLLDFIAYLPEGPFDMAEIGCYAGESSDIFAESGKFRTIHCIDTWGETAGKGYYTADAEPLFDAVAARHPEIIKKRKARSVDASAGFADGSLDIVYIDASHDVDSVRADIKAWAPKVKPGGFATGHDYNKKAPGVAQAVREYFKRPATVFADDTWLVRVGEPAK